MRKQAQNGKTVYVLGSGFSAPAGGPNQSALLKEIFDLTASDNTTTTCRDSLRHFLVETLHFNPQEITRVPLEDIYTPIDRCLNDGVLLRGRTQEQLLRLRGQIEYLISRAISRRFLSGGNRDYVNKFAQYLVNKAARRSTLASKPTGAAQAKAYDPFSIISLNWDILLDEALHRALAANDKGPAGEYDPIGIVDYCCYVSSFRKHSKRIRPGLWTLGAKGYNVKLLKIHGSMNWLQCPNCQRMFVGFEEKLILPNYVNPTLCRHCKSHGHRSKLRGTLVMPTFLKDLSNFQLKLVWQNAGVELMEARRLVFIGYSLPHADFEFRQLLTRMVHKDATIHVVLYKSRNRGGRRQYREECARYRQFFSGRKLTFEPRGVVEFVRQLTGASRRF